MSEPTPGTIELTCPGCQAYFRLKPKQGKFPRGPIPCPKCQTAIPLGPSSSSSGDAPTGERADRGLSSTAGKAPQSGVLQRSRIARGPSTSPALPALSDASPDAFLRAADKLLGDTSSPGLHSTFQGFGLNASLDRTSPNRELPDLEAEKERRRVKKNSTTDTSRFHREESTKAVGVETTKALNEAPRRRPSDQLDTPVGGVNPLSDLNSAQEQEPGPFDMRDIVEAERHNRERADPNEITRNPALQQGESPVPGAEPVAIKPRPEGFGALVSEPLVSRSDIFTDASAETPEPDPSDDSAAPERKELEQKAPSRPEALAQPLAAMLRQRLGPNKLDALRDTLAESSSAEQQESLTSTRPGAAGEEELDRMLDEVGPQRASGEHLALNVQQLPTAPAIQVSQEISRRLARLDAPEPAHQNDPTSEIDLSEVAKQSVSKPHIGRAFRQRVEQSERSAELEPGQAPPLKSVSLLAKLRPHRLPASDLTGEIAIAPHLRRAAQAQRGEEPDAVDQADEAPSGTFNRFDLTPERDDLPQGISWASAESVAAFQDKAEHAVSRKRRRQDSHSGLFPISGGLGQEDSLGLSSERRGSGYIRLPTSEIIDVLGEGQYRLLVEDIVYEPVDERGLTELVKRGVILGAEKIADAGGEWRPINEHPVFRRLKKKMAREAHALLAQYRQGQASPEREDDTQEQSERARPERAQLDAAPEALAVGDFSAPSASLIERLDDFSDELEESASFIHTLPPALPEPSAAMGDSGEQEEQEVVQVVPISLDEAISEALDEPAELAERDQEAPYWPVEEDEEPSLASEPSEPSQELLVAPEALAQDDELSDDDPLAPEIVPSPKASSSRAIWIVAALMLLGLGLITAALLTQPSLRSQLFGAPAAPGSSPKPDERALSEEKHGAPSPETLSEALSRAGEIVAQASAFNFSDAARSSELAAAFAAQGDHGAAATLYGLGWTPEADRTRTEAYIKALKQSERFEGLRRVAALGLGQGEEAERGFYEEVRREAIASDPAMRSSEPVTITSAWRLESGTPISTEHGVVFRLLDGQGQRWAFQPEQERYSPSQWERDTVAWRLCQLIACGLDVPQVMPATLASGGALAESIEELGETHQAQLAWRDDGGQGRALQGALRRWREPGAFWPMTYTATWRTWLTAYESPEAIEAPLKEALVSMKSRDPELYEGLTSQQPQKLNTRELAEGISRVVTFDFLMNNMNRFKPRVAYNGELDTQVLGERLASLDHATTMSARLSSRVRGRFGWVQRFDVEMIESIRALDPERSGALLFPEGSGISASEQSAFWSRREKVLEEVDALTQKYGKQSVLFFN